MIPTLSAITLTAPVMLAGLCMIGLPVVAHLMNRRARRRVVFPSVQLLIAAAASQSSLFKLRRWWLLLLRCLAVAAIVLAFAQPFWLGPRAQATGGQGAAVVIVIDRSASIGQQHAGVSAVHPIRSEATRVLDELVPGQDRANIVYATARPYAAFPGLITNIHSLRPEVDALSPTFEHADLTGALAMAGRMLAEHPGPKRLVILSDLQAGNWKQVAQGRLGDELLPGETLVTVLAPEQAPPGNLALHGAAASPGPSRVGQTVSLGVNVTNHSDRDASITVGLEVDGQPVDRQPVRVSARATAQVAFEHVYDGADFSRITFTLPRDGLEADNRCYLVLRGQDRAKVVLITDDDIDEPGTAGYFLFRALAPHGDDALDRFDVSRYRSGQPAWGGLDEASAVVVGDVGVLSSDKISALHRFMEAGGGVIYFCGRSAVIENLTALDKTDPGGVLPWTPAVPVYIDEELTLSDGAWRAPLLKPFGEAGRLALSEVPIRWAWSGAAIDERAAALLWYADGTPALVSSGVGAGRLVLANFSAAARDSGLGKQGLFVALMHGLVDSLNETRDTPTLSVGQLVHTTTARPIDIHGPAPVTEHPGGAVMQDVTLSIDEQTSVISLDAPDTPGFYTTRQGNTVVAVTAVNVDPRESDLSRVSADRLHELLDTDGVEIAGTKNNTGVALGLHGRSVWGWCLLAGMTCLGLEMLLLGAYKP